MESVGNGFVVYGQLTSVSLWASMTFLFTVFNLSVARSFGDNVAGDEVFASLTAHSQASFPTVRRLPAVALALYFN